MEIFNQTPLPLHVERNAEEDDRVTAIVLCALTCDLRGGELRVSQAQRPVETDPSLPYPHDAMWMKDRAASVCATGFVYAHEGRATEADAALAVGDQRVRVVAVGTRVWQRGAGGGVVPGPAEPFERVAMSWTNAYGGRVERPWLTTEIDGEQVLVPGHETHFPYNPEGKGFCLDPALAIDRPLPQLEDPDHRIRKLDDFAKPVCFAPYPLSGGMRAELILEDDQVTIDKDRIPRLPSKAMPALTFATLPARTVIALAGMRPDGEVLRFTTPESPVAATLAVGPDAQHVDFHLDAVDIDAEAAQVRLLYRGRFAYDLIRREQRSLTVTTTPALAALR